MDGDKKTATPQEKPREGEVIAGGLRLCYRDSGNGAPLLCLGSATGSSALPELLSPHGRVIELLLPMPAAPSVAPAIPEAATALGLDRCNLLARGDAAALALGFALDYPERVHALVLLGPTVIAPSGQPTATADEALAARLSALKVPVLALFGTKDRLAPPETGRHYRERIPSCNVVFVYDAGSAMAEDRPEAVVEVVVDFLERSDQFLVRRATDLLFR